MLCLENIKFSAGRNSSVTSILRENDACVLVEIFKNEPRVLGDPLLDHLAGDVGETEIATLEAIGETLVIHAEKVEHGGM